MGTINLDSFRMAVEGLAPDHSKAICFEDGQLNVVDISREIDGHEWTILPGKDDSSANLAVRMLLLGVLNREIGTAGGDNRAVKIFMDHARDVLLGKGWRDGDMTSETGKPLTARTIKELLVDAGGVLLQSEIAKFKAECPALVAQTGKILARLQTEAKGGPGVAPATQKRAQRMAIEFNTKLMCVYRDIEDGHGFGTAALRECHAGLVRADLEAKLETFCADADAVVKSFEDAIGRLDPEFAEPIGEAVPAFKSKLALVAANLAYAKVGVAEGKGAVADDLPALLADHDADFAAALETMKTMSKNALNAVANNIGRDRERFARVCADIDELVARHADKPAFAAFHGRTLKPVVDRLAAAFGDALGYSPDTLRLANVKLRAYVERLGNALERAGNDHAAFLTVLEDFREIPALELKDVASDYAYRRSHEDLGVLASGTRDRSDRSDVVSRQLKTLRGEIGKFFAATMALKDRDAKASLDAFANEVYVQLETSVGAAEAAGVDLGDGIAALAAPVLARLDSVLRAAQSGEARGGDGPKAAGLDVDAFKGAAPGRFTSLQALEKAKALKVSFDQRFAGAFGRLGERLAGVVNDRMTLRLDKLAGDDRRRVAKYLSVGLDGEASLSELGRGIVDDTCAAVLEAVKAKLLNDPPAGVGVATVEDILRDCAEEIDRTVALTLGTRVEAEDVVAEGPAADRYPRGRGLFGLDVGRLSEAERNGLMVIVRQLANSKLQKAVSADAGACLKFATENRTFGSAAGCLPDIPLAIEKAVWDGSLPLADVTEGRMTAICKFVDAFVSGRMANERTRGLGTDDVGAILSKLSMIGFGPVRLDRMDEKQINRLVEAVVEFYSANYNQVQGLDDLFLRVAGFTLEHYVGCASESPERARVKDIKESIGTAVRSGVKDWRQILDPLHKNTDEVKSAVRFLMREFVPTEANRADLLAFLRVLKSLRPGEARTVDFTFAGVTGHLTVTAEGRLSAKLPAIVRGNGNDFVPGEMPVSVPIGVEAFISQIEDVVVADVRGYGTDVARETLQRQREADPDGASFRTRQLCMNVICGVTGLRAADLCYAPTARLLELAESALDGMSADDVKARVNAKDDVKLLNSAGTLETYRRFVARKSDPGFRLSEKVDVPDPERVRKGETLAKARTRRLHEFAADLIQPNDTTKYDLDRQNGVAEKDILRATLLAHRAEIRMLLADPKLVDTFDIPADDGMSLSAFKDVLKGALATLSDLFVASGCDYDALFGMLARPTDADAARVDAFLADLRARLDASSTAVLEQLQAKFEAKLTASFEASKAGQEKELWKQTLDQIGGGGTVDTEAGYGLFLKNVIHDYFTEMEGVDRARMAAQVMRFSRADASPAEALGAMLKGAGPILQKLLQGLPQTTLPADLRTAVEDLKSNLAPIPEDAVRAYLLDMVDSSGGKITKISVRKSLGAASVGEVFLCTMYSEDHPEGEECVIKILRPDVQSRALREEGFFLRKAREAKLGDTLNARFDRIFEELDLVVEARNILKGSVYNPGATDTLMSVGFRSMTLDPHVSPTMNTMVLRRAPGETFDKYIKKIPSRIAEIVGPREPERRLDGSAVRRVTCYEEFALARMQLKSLYKDVLARQKGLIDFIAKWCYEGAFGCGFFHGDLHAGNLMSDGTTLTVIDFGNATQLAKVDQEQLMWLLSYIGVKSGGNLLDQMRAMLAPSARKAFDDVKAEMKDDIAEVFAKGRAQDIGAMFVAFVSRLQGRNVEIPGPLFNLMQSMQRLDETVRLMNEQLAAIKDAFASLVYDPSAEPAASEGDWIFAGAREVERGVMRDGTEEERRVLADLSTTLTTAQPPRSVNVVSLGNKPMTDLHELFESRLQAGEARRELRRGELDAEGKRVQAEILARMTDEEAFAKVRKDLRKFAERATAVGAPTAASILDELTAAEGIDGLFGEGAEAHRAEIAGKLASHVGTCLHYMRTPVCFNQSLDAARFEEPETFVDALGKAVGEGIEIFSAKVKSGGLGSLISGASLQSQKNAVQKVEDALRRRVASAETRIGELAGERGLTAREITVVKGAAFDFRFPARLRDAVANGKWATKPEVRKDVLDALRFSIGAFKSALAKAGLSARMADQRTMGTYAELLAIGFSAMSAPLFKGFKGMSEAEFSALEAALAGEAELRALVTRIRTEARSDWWPRNIARLEEEDRRAMAEE